MPTIEQIRAARALIGWSQKDLADHADLSQTGVARIENGTNQPNSSTIAKIRAAFDKAGVEFLDSSGVKKRVNEIKVLKGVEGFRILMDDVYNTAKSKGGKISILNGTPSAFLKWLDHDWYMMHAARMTKIKSNYDFRIVAARDESGGELATGFATYRWIDGDLFYNNSVYIYGDSVAFITFSENDVVIEVANRPSFAATFNLIFEYVWKSLQ